MGLLIVGTGALACLFAARLASSGNEVTMLGSWQNGLAALRQHGVRLLEMDGSIHQNSVNVIDGSNCRGNFREALVLVKAWQTPRAALQIKPILDSPGIALTLQNGLGNYETLVDVLGQGRAALGVTTVGARMLEPGYVQNTGEGKVTLGFNPKLTGLIAQLSNAGFNVETTTNTESLLWGKLVINSAINPLTSLLRVANGELLERPSAHELLKEAARESANVAIEQGINLPYANIEEAVEDVARKTGSNISSMLQDVLRGTPTEIEAINGAIIQAGEKIGVATPINRMLWRLVRSIDRQ